ncbi:Translation initiation factor IF-2, mitochondrial [Cercospora beticola]|uniref:Translation initiation factor IF-2, mitochondrial n=1 Tax=Cercospora beticola TaxID=122368 RepID=A0A2G5HXG9_CERBT|nr:Translation initiation factor IF-2, mitochondrial [Cercospora beticola]PIA97201.1 Translation initiation factor IF-2, mitochondrial [Cercospora beticola]WPA98357.1 hypothetical protein RHO25_002969 [Cercospora beticola]CAK1359597.1 unnamed protein product [Cercospora beticola]
MRRQRTLRTASASSLCIFCACRLGAIELPATSVPLNPLRSSSQRRSISTTRAPFQRTATASIPSAVENASDSFPAWYDPTSSLSMSEQRERANRVAARQQFETEQNQVRQERLWKEEEEKNQLKQEAEAKRKVEREKRSQHFKQQSLSRASRGIGLSAGGSTLGQAMMKGGHSRNSKPNAAPNVRPVATPREPRIRISYTGARSPGRAEQTQAGKERAATTSVVKPPPKKVSNPFGVPAAVTTEPANEPSSGWGVGSTQTAPLEYAEAPAAVVHRRAAETNTNVQENSAFRVSLGGYTKSFRPSYGDVDQQHNENIETIEGVKRRNEQNDAELQSQQEAYDRAAKKFAASSPQYSSSVIEDSGEGEVERNSRPHRNDVVGNTEHFDSGAVQPTTTEETVRLQDNTPVSSETAALEAERDVEAASPQRPPHSSRPSAAESLPVASGLGSFGHFEAEAESTAQPATSDVPPAQEESVSPESHHGQSELGTSTPSSIDQPAQETTQDQVPEQNAQQPAAPAAPSPLSQLAQQTQQTVSQPGHSTGKAVSQQASTPPPPPTAAPPPAHMIPSGGQLVWQPIHGHPQGGQWTWQASPPSFVAPPPPATTTEPPSHSQYTPPQYPQANSTARAPSVSLSDSGYRAMPFSPDEYQTRSSFDEEKAANWQHLRRRESQPTEPIATSPPPTQPQPQPQPQQTQHSQFHQDFDDESWVDWTFNNHVREREERLKLQKEREEKQKAQKQRSQSVQGQEMEGSRRLYNGPAQAYRDKECARCGERGHIARYCTKKISPFDRPNGESNEFRQNRGSDTRTQRSSESRTTENDRLSNPFAAPSPFGARGSAAGAASNPFANREPLSQPANNQRPRKAWGADQVISTEPPDMPKREPRFRVVPTVAADEGVATNPGQVSKWDPEAVAGQHAERHEHARAAETERTADSKSARRSERFQVESDIDEHAPAPESRASRDKAARKSRWADDEDDVFADKGKGAGRKAQRAGRREYDEEEDDEAEARDNFRARKAARQAEKEAKGEKRLKNARREREVKKAEDATPISIPEFVSVQQLSQMLGVRYEQFIDRLQELGYDDVFPGMTLNSETSGMIAMEYNFDPTIDTGVREEEERDLKPRPEVEDKEFLPTRPPVVTIMGHVDHGKTTILDYLRKSSVAAGEAGGITQHIGAFSVPMASSGKTITFLDTPGHAAFLAMRQRGANVTDIVILVVAADDSVKPQTLEAIKHAKAAGVPMIVAINKVDKEGSDIQRVKQDLARHGVEIEDFGGETQVVPVSGKTGQGMDGLEETVVALSEIIDQRAETDGAVEGWVLEATTKANGRVATVLVRRGTLKPGAVIVAGKTWARVRSLRNEGGRTLQEVGPGMPVEVDGWRDQPMAGDEVLQAPSEQKATSVVEYRQEREEREKAAADMEAINEARRLATERQQREREAAQALKQAQRTANAEGGTADVVSKPDDLDAPQQEQSGQIDVPFIIKADVSGSAEAVSAYIMSVSNPLITPSVLQSHVGPVHESDIELANAAGGHIIAFNLPPDPQMQGKAEAQGVKILENNIIYRVLDDVKAVLEEKLPPILTQRVLGEAEIGAAFEISVGGRKKVKIAGCKVRNGMVEKGSRVRVMRGSEKVYDGTINSLKNVKKDVTEMRKGSECGMGFDDWESFEVGDQVQTYEEIRERRKL